MEQHDSTIRADVVLAEMRAGFDGLNRRVDGLKDEVRYTNGKVTKAGQDIAAHAADLEVLKHENERRRRDAHEMRNTLQSLASVPHVVADLAKKLEGQVVESTPLESVSLTLGSLKGIVIAIVGTVVATFAVLSALGWHR